MIDKEYEKLVTTYLNKYKEYRKNIYTNKNIPKFIREAVIYKLDNESISVLEQALKGEVNFLFDTIPKELYEFQDVIEPEIKKEFKALKLFLKKFGKNND